MRIRHFLLPAALAAGFLAPLARASREPELPAPFDDVESAARALAASGAHGAELVEDARRAVRDRFATYSAMAPWEPSATAFRRRRGFSAQYNVALVDLLRRLGFEAEAVFAARIVEEHERPWWRNAHVWVRVWVDGRPHEICAGLSHDDGTLAFAPVTPVLPFGHRTRLNTAIVLTVAAAWQQWRHLLTGEPLPRWMQRPFTAAS